MSLKEILNEEFAELTTEELDKLQNMERAINVDTQEAIRLIVVEDS